MNSKDKEFIKCSYVENDNQDSLINPSLLIFPFNNPSEKSLSLQEDQDEAIKFTLAEGSDKKRNLNKILIGESKNMLYDSKSKTKDNHSQYIVALFSKKKRSLTFVDIDSIFPLNQRIKKVEQNAKDIDYLKLNQEKPNKDIFENKMQLVTDFGTSKAKKQMNSIKTNKVSEDNISSLGAMKEILQENAKSVANAIITNEQEQLNNKVMNLREYLPEFNLEAQKPKDIFNLYSIISEKEFNQINHKDILKMLKVPEVLEESKPNFSEFVYNLLKTLIEPLRNDVNVSKKIKISIYLDALFTFWNMPKTLRKPPTELANLTNIPLFIINDILEKFYQKTYYEGEKVKHVQTFVLQLKHIFHIIVLVFMAYNFEFNYLELAKTLKIEDKKMMEYLKEIGATFVQTKSEDKKKTEYVQLNAPLKFAMDKKHK